jgi:hypothetical protein
MRNGVFYVHHAEALQAKTSKKTSSVQSGSGHQAATSEDITSLCALVVCKVYSHQLYEFNKSGYQSKALQHLLLILV